MKKFLILYYSKIPAQERMDDAGMDKMKASMDAWMEWKERHGNALVDFGSPVRPAKKLENGAVSDSVGWTTGFSLVQAESVDDAVELMKDHPNFKNNEGIGIEILEFLSMPGM